MIEKILAKASHRREVVPGEVVMARVDLMVMHDLSASFVTRVFEEELAGGTIDDPSRIVFVFDHNFSAATEKAAASLFKVREFARKHGIRYLFDGGQGSLHHVVLEQGLWAPGQIIIGCDSHTPIYGALGVFATGVGNNSMAALGFQHSAAWFRVPETIHIVLEGETGLGVSARDIAQFIVGTLGEAGAVYKAVEYGGAYLEALPVADRLLFPLMSIDLGAKAAFIDPDETTVGYVRAHSAFRDFDLVGNDPDVVYERTVEVDVSEIEPQVACPPTVGNVQPAAAVSGVPIQLAEVGGSTGGRFEDLSAVAAFLRGRKVHPDVRFQVVPATRGVYKRALQEGVIEALFEAGATIFPPSAGSNQAVNMGAMCEDEAMISSQARNFPGRNGHPGARHYLASSETVAASAIRGAIADPREFL